VELKTINNYATQESLDRNQQKGDNMGCNIEPFKPAVKKIGIPPAQESNRTGQYKQGTGNDYFCDVVWGTPLEYHCIIANAEKCCNDDAYRRKGDVCKRDLFKEVALPPGCNEKKEQGGADQCNREVYEKWMGRLNDKKGMDYFSNESHNILLLQISLDI
jgi:hypothetical protein